MRAGKLDKSITIERFATTVDDFGTETEAWTPVATVRAQLIQASTEEAIRAFGTNSESVSVFRIRHHDGIVLADRVVYAGQAYDLKEVKELGRREGLELRCVMAGA